MDPKLKPGDVVELNQHALDNSWGKHFRRMNGATFIIHSQAVDEGVHLLRMTGRKVLWNQRLFIGERERGVWEGWLQRNELLTAVHKAQKKHKPKHKGVSVTI